MAGQDAAKRRGPGLRAIAATVPGATRSLRQRRGLAHSALIQEWPTIIGELLARQCYPQRLVRGQAGGAGTLHLAVAGPLALELQHLAPQVIERVNSHFGFAAVARLSLHQVAPIAVRPTPTKPPPRAPDPQTEAALEAQLETVTDPDLRAALDRLGRAVLAAPPG